VALQVWENGSLKDICNQIKDLNAVDGLPVSGTESRKELMERSYI
jgi:hypothetical protein